MGGKISILILLMLPSFRRFASIAAIISLPISLACLLFSLIAIDFNMDAFSDYSLLLAQGEQSASPWRWAMLLDLFGYYLLIVPVVLYLRSWLIPKGREWMNLATIGLLTYSLVGAIGAVILATTLPPILESHAAALEPQRSALEATFTSWSTAVYSGLWNLLEQLAGGIGWLIIGLILHNHYRKLALLTTALGISCLIDAFGSILGLEAIASIGQSVYLILAPLWAGILGIVLWRTRAIAAD